MPKKPQILFGPAGWSYADWEGIVYPQRKPRGFHPAAYLAQFFDTIEINTSFYNPLRPEVASSWVGKVSANPKFQFTAKLWKRFTHERGAGPEDEKVCKQGLRPLAEAGRLGALLLQFPWSFKNTPENRDYLGQLFTRFVEYPLVLEVRHNSWNEPEIFAWLGAENVGFCNIDQPVIGRSLAPSEHATTPIGYVRLHGRNYQNWFTAEQSHERYDYLYTTDELKPWAERVGNLSQNAELVLVIANNHFEGKAVANALQLSSMVRGERVPVPESLSARYPQLEEVASPAAAPSEPQRAGLLFGRPDDLS